MGTSCGQPRKHCYIHNPFQGRRADSYIGWVNVCGLGLRRHGQQILVSRRHRGCAELLRAAVLGGVGTVCPTSETSRLAWRAEVRFCIRCSGGLPPLLTAGCTVIDPRPSALHGPSPENLNKLLCANSRRGSTLMQTATRPVHKMCHLTDVQGILPNHHYTSERPNDGGRTCWQVYGGVERGAGWLGMCGPDPMEVTLDR